MFCFFRFVLAYVTCPTAYLCDESEMSNVSMCVDRNHVCDGKADCLEGDDETQCGMLGHTLVRIHKSVKLGLKLVMA